MSVLTKLGFTVRPLAESSEEQLMQLGGDGQLLLAGWCCCCHCHCSSKFAEEDESGDDPGGWEEDA